MLSDINIEIKDLESADLSKKVVTELNDLENVLIGKVDRHFEVY